MVSFLFNTVTAVIVLFQFSLYQSETHLNLENGLAVKGYDLVSYFSESKAVKGTKNFSYKYYGATYYFSSDKNLATFRKSPEQYLPQYGGYCAFAMGDYGEKVDINPKTFKVKEGKLFLFYNAYFNNTLTSWNEDEEKLKISADKNWNNIINAK
ncbi:YHS domain-containing (seleno)protein [uncultured Cyclobacterium sp.]|uniref:YHS domain-containing (seleno)protein n=1 Tax=uncultured Cyclobacterium sp. TaxID=453820 RepID=UPI0030EDF9D4|tara:strand:- start:17861 stop:18322 length:462 start_codon:yes stop_codon:yes gene_type:complete